MTTHPSLTKARKPRAGYIQFKRNPNPKSKQKSYFHKSIKRIYSPKNGMPRLSRRKWSLSKKDLKKLRKMDRHKIKNVRPVTN